MRRNPPEIGSVFGRLTVLRDCGVRVPTGPRYVECKCECGTVREFQFRSLYNGRSKSCGCMHREIIRDMSTIHGGHNSTLYSIWSGMRQRCENPRRNVYQYYGGRGISVCSEWASFEAFRSWATEWSEGLTLERVDNDNGYSPQNCRWATRMEQSQNTRRSHKIEFDGKPRCIAEIARMTGVNHETLRHRLSRGVPLSEAIL